MSQQDTTEALIYTNDHNEVAYVNLHFLRMMRYDRTRPVVGRPLAHALQVPTETVSALKKQALAKDYAQMLMELVDGAQSSWHVLLTTTPTVDEHGNFIGLNITFAPVFDPAPFRSDPNILPARITLEFTAPTQTTPVSASNLAQNYVIAQVEGLQTFLARIMGMGVRDRMEETINRSALKQGWPLQMTNGHIEVSAPDGAWQSPLLHTAVRYGIDVAGETWINREMVSIEQSMEPTTVEQAQAAGLRSYFS
jgi:hypothetical protein